MRIFHSFWRTAPKKWAKTTPTSPMSVLVKAGCSLTSLDGCWQIQTFQEDDSIYLLSVWPGNVSLLAAGVLSTLTCFWITRWPECNCICNVYPKTKFSTFWFLLKENKKLLSFLWSDSEPCLQVGSICAWKSTSEGRQPESGSKTWPRLGATTGSLINTRLLLMRTRPVCWQGVGLGH